MSTFTFNGSRSRLTLVALVLGALLIATRAVAADPCPADVRLHGNSATSSADYGWTGTAHQQPLPDWDLRLGVTNCAGATQPTCGQCDVSGLIPNGGRS